MKFISVSHSTHMGLACMAKELFVSHIDELRLKTHMNNMHQTDEHSKPT